MASSGQETLTRRLPADTDVPAPSISAPRTASSACVASTGQETLPRALPADADSPAPSISVVIPVYNEAASLRELYSRAVESLDGAGHSFDMIDGARTG